MVGDCANAADARTKMRDGVRIGPLYAEGKSATCRGDKPEAYPTRIRGILIESTEGDHVTPILSPEETKDFLKRGFSRRNFGRIATLLTAGAAMPFYNEPALAQLSKVKGTIPPDAVLINANENPMGPCPEAAEAIRDVVQKGGRYMYQLTDDLAKMMADVEGVKPDYVRPFAGSSAPLHQSVLAFCSPQKSYVVGDPGYEAGGRAAKF